MRKRIADKKDEAGGESAGELSLITGLDLIMVATGGHIGRFSLGGRIERGSR